MSSHALRCAGSRAAKPRRSDLTPSTAALFCVSNDTVAHGPGELVALAIISSVVTLMIVVVLGWLLRTQLLDEAA
ncbi:MAG: hypothetical protein AB7P03_30025 [Kofleriaceae bacterium]